MRGKRRQGTSAIREARALFAIPLALSAALACGSRSTLIDDEPGEDHGAGTGGTALGGSAGRSPMSGGRGALTGTAGRPDSRGSAGRGDTAAVGGAPARGGAGEAGSGGGGFYGSPAMIAACDHLCPRTPTVCKDFPSDESECRSSCYLAAQTDKCVLELADYTECLAARLNRDATCTLSNDGCRGRGCTSTAIDDCSSYAKVYTTCDNTRCYPIDESFTDTCVYHTFCTTHWRDVDCSLTDAATSTWDCTCSVDGSPTFSQRVVGAGASSCRTLVTACNLSK